MSTPLVIIGAGGLGREIHEIVAAIAAIDPGAFELLGFVDAAPDHRELVTEKAPILGGDEVLESLPAGTRYVIGINDVDQRRRVDALALGHGLTAATLVHPRAVVARDHVLLGPGTTVAALASISTNVRTGRHVHIDIGATVAHDGVLGDFTTVSPGARLSGTVTVGDDAYIGSAASVRQGLTVGDGALVGMGAVVVADVPARTTVVGVPARPLARS